MHAHPDDETINNGATMARYVAEGHQVTLVTCTAGERGDTNGITLFLVDAAANGVARRSYVLRDGMRAAEITLSGVEVSDDAVLGGVDGAFPVIERVVETGIAAMAAEAVGAMQTMQTMTLEYLKTRQQFGQPIGRNQALQHRATEMFVALEQGRSMAMLAAMIAATV